MFEKILIADDLTTPPDLMLSCLPTEKLGVKAVVLVHVLNAPQGFSTGQELLENFKAKLWARGKMLKEKGFKCKEELVVGVPGRAILELAEKHDVSLVICGSHHRGSFRGSLIGSVSYSVLHEMARPTLLFRLSDDTTLPPKPVEEGLCTRHILFPTDFSDTAENAFVFLERIATATGAAVTLYHVHDQTRIDPYLRDRLPEFDRKDRERLERLRQHLEANGSGPCSVQVSYGIPAQRILKLARSGDYSLIILGAQGRGYIPEIFLGSTANAIARHAPLPVLFIPHSHMGTM